ncbi:MAG: hypothetical protein WD844_14500 [Thermoleophilaceae bacterium]
MTPTPEAVVRGIYASWHEGRSARDWIAEELEYVNPPDAVEPGTRRGRATLRVPFEAYEQFDVTPEEYLEAGADRILVLATVRVRARRSGVEDTTRQGYLWTVRDGRAIRFEWFREPAQALRAVGISGRS